MCVEDEWRSAHVVRRTTHTQRSRVGDSCSCRYIIMYMRSLSPLSHPAPRQHYTYGTYVLTSRGSHSAKDGLMRGNSGDEGTSVGTLYLRINYVGCSGISPLMYPRSFHAHCANARHGSASKYCARNSQYILSFYANENENTPWRRDDPLYLENLVEL